MRPWCVSLALLTACGLLAVGCGPGFDPYDDAIRGTNPGGTSRVEFGQRIGPDGDGCWPNRGKVYCDLVSIGGLHWDAGDIRVEKSVDIDMGPGFLCLRDTEGMAWCWEWSPDVPPRPARVPQGAQFAYISVPAWVSNRPNVPGFVCGQVSDFFRIICWSVGVDQPDYRQSTHRFTRGGEWGLRWADDDPPSFSVDNRGPLKDGKFDAFTGKELRQFPRVPPVLMTETLP